MNIPNLEDVSIELRDKIARLHELQTESDLIEAEARKIWSLIASDEDPEREHRIAAIVDGRPRVPQEPLKKQYAKLRTYFADIQDAKRSLDHEVSSLQRQASKTICQRLEPLHDQLLKKVSEGLVSAHTAALELYDLKRNLVAKGIQFPSLFNLMPDFLGHPRDRGSDFADFMRGAARAGLGKAPKAFA